MGVYQSATEPKVGRRQLREVYSHSQVEMMGQDNIIRYLRKRNNIPRKVRPDIRRDNDAITYWFSWFEVETFN